MTYICGRCGLPVTDSQLFTETRESLKHPILRWHITCSHAQAAEIDRLRAALVEAQWRAIETAPKDGSWILVWRAYSTVPFVARYDAEYAAFEDTFGDHVYRATHWMPLPPAPEESE